MLGVLLSSFVIELSSQFHGRARSNQLLLESNTEAEIIYFDAGLRIEELPVLRESDVNVFSLAGVDSSHNHSFNELPHSIDLCHPTLTFPTNVSSLLSS